MPTRPFKSDLVLKEQISSATLRGYNVGFEENRFRLEPLVDVILEVIPEYADGYHEGSSVSITQVVEKIRKAAKKIYTTDDYEHRGEFGELILHLLLRDFCGTIPLISKIYFKDADNATVHGFDGVHIAVEGDKKELWLGESKLYKDGKAGVKALAEDLEKHLKRDYLKREFNLISSKLTESTPDIEYWRRMLHEHQNLDKVLNVICIPMVCTYSSTLFGKHNDSTNEYLNDFIEECKNLEKVFEGKKIETNVDVILMLLPIPSKDELVEKLNERLKRMQSI